MMIPSSSTMCMHSTLICSHSRLRMSRERILPFLPNPLFVQVRPVFFPLPLTLSVPLIQPLALVAAAHGLQLVGKNSSSDVALVRGKCAINGNARNLRYICICCREEKMPCLCPLLRGKCRA